MDAGPELAMHAIFTPQDVGMCHQHTPTSCGANLTHLASPVLDAIFVAVLSSSVGAHDSWPVGPRAAVRAARGRRAPRSITRPSIDAPLRPR